MDADSSVGKRSRLFSLLRRKEGGIHRQLKKTKKGGRQGQTKALLVAGVVLMLGTLGYAGLFLREEPVAQAQQENAVQNEEVVCMLRQDALGAFYGGENQKARLSVEAECPLLKEETESVPTESVTSFEQEMKTLLAGHPMAAMASAMAKQDRMVAAFLIGIAKKESNWGKHVPTLNGTDCYNYWGYKGAGSRGTGMGYACFGSPEEAVSVVGGRLAHFVYATHRDTPAKMIIWKCGSSCAGHSPESVQSWISSVSLYFHRVMQF